MAGWAPNFSEISRRSLGLGKPEQGYFSAVASGAAWLSGAAKPVVKALRKSLGEQKSSLKRYQIKHQTMYSRLEF